MSSTPPPGPSLHETSLLFEGLFVGAAVPTGIAAMSTGSLALAATAAGLVGLAWLMWYGDTPQ